jgi:hypothetical protein
LLPLLAQDLFYKFNVRARFFKHEEQPWVAKKICFLHRISSFFGQECTILTSLCHPFCAF